MNHSLQKLNEPNNRYNFNGVCFDSGGGGVGSVLVKNLKKNSYIDEKMLMATCSLYRLILVLTNEVTDLIGFGGLGKKNSNITFIYLLLSSGRIPVRRI